MSREDDSEVRKQAKDLLASMSDILALGVEAAKLDAKDPKMKQLIGAAFEEVRPTLASKAVEDAAVAKIKREPAVTALETAVLNGALGGFKNSMGDACRLLAFANLLDAGESYEDWAVSATSNPNPTEAEIDATMEELVKRLPPVIDALKSFDPAKGAEIEAKFSAAKSDALAAKARGSETDYILKTWGIPRVFEDILKYVEALEPEMEALADKVESALDSAGKPGPSPPGVG